MCLYFKLLMHLNEYCAFITPILDYYRYSNFQLMLLFIMLFLPQETPFLHEDLLLKLHKLADYIYH